MSARTSSIERGVEAPTARYAVATLAIVTASLLVLRIAATARVGFGDSEALYAVYALHPEPAYLDHPGLIGVFASAIGGAGIAPSPMRAHVATTILATIAPLILFWTARTFGATVRGAAIAAVGFALAPEIAIGMFAMTPDLLLAPAWILTLGFAAKALRSEPNSLQSATYFLLTGLLIGVASASKISGVCLALAIVATCASRTARPHLKTVWPYGALILCAIVLSPIVRYEIERGAPMLRHRLVTTQSDAAISLRNFGAVFFGQLAYLSPPIAFLIALSVRDLWRSRGESQVAQLLLYATLIPLSLLGALSCWSRVAEPHWLAPAFIAPAIHLAKKPQLISRRLARASIAITAAIALSIHAWVLVPSLIRFAPASYEPRYDLANELYGWPDVTARVRRELDAIANEGERAVVVGPHWIVCAQLHAALGPSVPVGCTTPIPDDFDTWLPRAEWKRAPIVLFVTDNRFDAGPPIELRERAVAREELVDVRRDSRVVRTFRITRLVRSAAALN